MRTPWFHPKIRPVHPGYYETSRDPTEYHVIDYWDGSWWKHCKTEKRYYVLTEKLYWRGLTEKQE